MRPIDIAEVMQEGDGAPLPKEVELEALRFEGYGSYDLEGVILSSNGVLKVKANERTDDKRPHQWEGEQELQRTMKGDRDSSVAQ